MNHIYQPEINLNPLFILALKNKGFIFFIGILVTIIGYILSILVLNNYNELNETIYQVIFIGLASLTFPHILLEYLIGKNEQ